VVHVFGVSSRIHDAKELMARLRAFTDREKVFAQAFDPCAVASERQLLLAYKLAEGAFAEKRNIAKTMEAEVLVRAAATRKIEEAIARLGAKGGNFLLLTDAEGKKLEALLKAIDGKRRKTAFAGEKAAKLYGVKKLPGYSIEELILERMAMLEAEK
jgi:tRNA threonylcarbamoyladenosine modification (KEOPS) complex Cgi121 subunit